MRSAHSHMWGKIFALVLFLSSVTMLFGAAEYYEKMVIKVDGKAKSTGALVFSFTPESGDAKEIKVTIAKEMNKYEITDAIVKEFKVVLGDAYKVRDEDSDKVKIGALKNSPKFTVEMKEGNIQGVSLVIKKD